MFKSDFETIDYEVIAQEMKQSLIEKWRSLGFHVDELLESDPGCKVIEIAAYQELYLRQRVKEAMKKVFIESAQGEDLNNLARLFYIKREENESDAKFRARIMIPRYIESSIGTQAAYEECTRSHPDVQDAKAICNESSKIDIIILLKEQGENSPDSINAIIKTIKDKIEPLRIITDYVVVKVAPIHPYEISAELSLRSGPGGFEVGEEAMRRLKKYIKENYKLGQTITLAGIYHALTLPGVYKIDLKSPLDEIYVKDNEASKCNKIELTLITPTGNILLNPLNKDEIYA